jgi:hypothetical protein
VGERLPHTQEVGSSILSAPTIFAAKVSKELSYYYPQNTFCCVFQSQSEVTLSKFTDALILSAVWIWTAKIERL